jgi:hypothetical protein
VEFERGSGGCCYVVRARERAMHLIGSTGGAGRSTQVAGAKTRINAHLHRVTPSGKSLWGQ